MRKLYCMFFVILALFVVACNEPTPVSKPQSVIDSKVEFKKNSANKVKVGYFTSPGFMQGKSDSETKSGYGYEYLQDLASYTGWNYEYVYGDWAELLEKLQRGEIDVMPDVSYTAERSAAINFPQHSMGKESYYIIASIKNASISKNDLGTLNGKRIGVNKNSVQEGMLKKWIEKNQLKIEVVPYEMDMAARIKDMNEGIIDASVETSIDLSVKNVYTVVKIGESDFYLAVAKNRLDLLKTLDSSQKKMVSTNPRYMEDLFFKYFTLSAFSDKLSEEETAWLDAHSELRVGLLDNYMPYSGYDDQSGENTGAVVSIVNLMTSTLNFGKPVKFFTYKTYEQMREAFVNGEVDVVGPVLKDLWRAEQYGVMLTENFAPVSIELIYNKHVNVKNIKTVAVTQASPLSVFYAENKLPTARLVYYESLEDCVLAVESGSVDATYMSSLVAQVYTQGVRTLHGVNIVESVGDASFSFAVLNGNAALLTLLNRGISNLNPVEVNNIITDVAVHNFKPSLFQLLQDFLVPIVAIFALIFVLFICILALARVRRRLLAANEKTRKINEEMRSQMDVIQSMGKIYYTTYLIDVDHDTFIEFSSNKDIHDVVGSKGKAREKLSFMAEQLIDPEFADAMRCFVDLNTIDARLKDKNVITFDFKGKTMGWSQAYLIAGNKTESGHVKSLFIATRSINDEKERELAANRQIDYQVKTIQDKNVLIKAISEIYSELYNIDLKNDSFVMVRSTPVVRAYTSQFTSSYACLMGLAKIMYPAEDYETVRSFYDTSTWPERLKIHDTVVADFRGKISGWLRVNLIVVDRDSDGMPRHVLVAIQNVNQFMSQIYESKQATEIALAEARVANRVVERVHEALHSASWTMEFDENGNPSSAIWSNAFRKMMGFESVEDFPNDFETWYSRIAPEDKEFMNGKVGGALKDFKNAVPTIDVEHRFITKNNGVRWYRACAHVTRRADGSPSSIYGIYQDIDDRKKQQEELQLALSTANTATEAMNAIHVATESGAWTSEYNADGCFSSVKYNQTFRQMLGYESEDDFPNTQEAIQKIIHPDDREKLASIYGDSELQNGTSNTFNIQFRVKIKSGAYRRFTSAGHVIRNERGLPQRVYGLLQDVNDRVNAEIQLKEQFGIINALAENFVDIVTYNRKEKSFNLVRYSGIVAGFKNMEISSISYEEGIESYVFRYVYEEDRADIMEKFDLGNITRELEINESVTYHYRVNLQGSLHYYMVKCARVGEFVDSIVFAFACEDEEQNKSILLENALADAERANNSKTVFLNSMSHDIRTPMNAIIGFTNLAQKHVMDSRLVLEYLGKIQVSSDHLLNLINDVLDMSRIESGKVSLEPKLTHLPGIVEELNTIVLSDVRSRNLKFNVSVKHIENEYVYCDKLRLDQVLLNILSNAMKFSKNGGTVDFSLCELSHGVDGYAMFEFRIKDTGIGISEEFQKHVFEPFEREQTATISGIQGTGLGLSITKSFVDMMGGTIELVSTLGVGSEFIITLPFKIAKAPEASKNSEIKKKPQILPAKDFVGKRILLVEDNELNREIAETVLKEYGFIVESVTDGTFAVERIKKSKPYEFDLVLMDVQMPVMNGYDATRLIREMGKNRADLAKLPIYAMTANAFEKDKQNAIDAGMNGHIAKPIEVDKLMLAVGEALGQG